MRSVTHTMIVFETVRRRLSASQTRSVAACVPSGIRAVSSPVSESQNEPVETSGTCLTTPQTSNVALHPARLSLDSTVTRRRFTPLKVVSSPL